MNGNGRGPTRVAPLVAAARGPAPAAPLPRLRAWPEGSRRRAADPADWFLAAGERGNPDTHLDCRHADGRAWTMGNRVEPLIHGARYFEVLHREISRMGPGDLLLFTDWRGDPDERLDGPGTEVALVMAEAARRGVDVRGLLWRSHHSGLRFHIQENRELGETIEEAGGQCLLDMRVRSFGSHHQKLVVLRHRDRPEDDVAFIGGIDLCHSRRDDDAHHGDPQALPMAEVYGPRPAWHDVQLEVRGPAVADAELVFRERWDDSTPLTLHPVHLASQLVHRERLQPRPMPPQAADPQPHGTVAVQLLRTYPSRHPRYPFARHGEHSIARGYAKALSRARRLVYVEDQYLWSEEVASVFAEALRRAPELRMVFVIPRFAEQDGRWSMPPNLVGREAPLRMLRRAGGDRVAVYGLENPQGRPVYVHAKACVVDDLWACVGSDNTNRRSWTHDSELSAAFVDVGAAASEGTEPASDGAEHGPVGAVRDLRLRLAREHLGEAADDYDLDDPVQWFEAFRAVADALDAWHASGRSGARPPGRLRTYHQQRLPALTRAWATLAYRVFYDPDGRHPWRRWRGGF